MRPKIWLCTANCSWLERAIDDEGTLNISKIAELAGLLPDFFIGDERAFEGITIEHVRYSCGSTAGLSKNSAVLVHGDPKPAAHTEEGPPLKKSKVFSEAPSPFQEFVRSAENNFLACKLKKFLSGCEDSKEENQLLAVGGDLLGVGPTGLIWIRKCYEDLMRILVGAKEGERFIFQGTAGVGKSMFELVWISYLATQKKKVVFKSSEGSFYLLDFTLAEPKAFESFTSSGDHALEDVLYDSSSWLILDGKQVDPLRFPCRMLLACSNEKKNYHEFAKHCMSQVRYVPVWTQEEVEEFLEDIEPHRSVYGHMPVPDKETVMKDFRLFGGVPRFLFGHRNNVHEEQSMRNAIENLDRHKCLKLFDGDHSDQLVHMKNLDDTYMTYQCDFASRCVLEKVWQQLQSMAKLDTVHYLERLLRSPSTGAAFGSMYELVAHNLLAQGGKFKMKRVYKDKEPEAVADLVLEKKSEKMVFKELGDLKQYNAGDYCQPMSNNLASVDALILPDTLLQYFHYIRGNHGYKIKGLQALDDVLKQTEYRLISCVPKDSYDSTGFQNYLYPKGTQVITGHKDLERKMNQFVAMVDFKLFK